MAYYVYNKVIPEYNEKYVFFDPIIKNELLQIIGAGIVYPDKNYGYKKVRDCHIFEYIVKGEGHIESEGRVYDVKAGDCIIGRQDRFVRYYSDKDVPYIKLWFSAKGKFVDNLFDSFALTSAVTVATVDMQSQFEGVLAELENGKYSLEEMSHRILDIFFAVHCNSNKTGEPHEKPSDVKYIKSYIDTYINGDVSLERIASHFNTSVKKIIEVFKREMGMTPHRYIKEERLRSAKRMLEGTENTVTEIAQALNFCEQSYFSAEFKKAFGMYPTEYRKAFREQPGVVKYRDFGITYNINREDDD